MNNQDEKWLPKVGQKYLHHKGAAYVVDEITNLATTDEAKFPVTVNYTRLDDNTKWSRPLSEWVKKFRPIQSPADKERAEQVKLMAKHLCPGNEGSWVYYLNDAEFLIDSGWVRLKPGQKICTPLTDEQKDLIRQHFKFAAPEESIAAIIYAVHKELGLIED